MIVLAAEKTEPELMTAVGRVELVYDCRATGGRMTLIVTLISDEYVILASDRRVTWFDAKGRPERHDDRENKAIVLGGQFLMGYTGFAEFGGMRTEQWVCETLVGIDPSQQFQTLADRSEAEVARIKKAYRLPLKRCGHAFVGAGYGKLRDGPDDFVACGITISNAMSTPGECWHPSEAFAVTRTPPLTPEKNFWLGTFGAEPSAHAKNRAVDLIRRYRKRDRTRVLGICQIMVDLIRSTAKADPDQTISEDVSVSVLPRAGMPADNVSVPLGGIIDPVERLTCAYVPAHSDMDHALAYVPAIPGQQISMFGSEVWTTKPPWWRDE